MDVPVAKMLDGRIDPYTLNQIPANPNAIMVKEKDVIHIPPPEPTEEELAFLKKQDELQRMMMLEKELDEWSLDYSSPQLTTKDLNREEIKIILQGNMEMMKDWEEKVYKREHKIKIWYNLITFSPLIIGFLINTFTVVFTIPWLTLLILLYFIESKNVFKKLRRKIDDLPDFINVHGMYLPRSNKYDMDFCLLPKYNKYSADLTKLPKFPENSRGGW